MPNFNTFERFVGANSPAQGLNAIPSLALASNVETLFINQLGSTAIQSVNNGALPGSATAPSFGNGFDGFPFKVRVCFKATTAGTSTAIISLYVGSTIVAGNQIATVTSQSLATASASGQLEATLMWDNVSQKLWGQQMGFFGTSVKAAVTIPQNPTVTSLNGLVFVCTANLGSAVAATFTLTEFCLESV